MLSVAYRRDKDSSSFFYLGKNILTLLRFCLYEKKQGDKNGGETKNTKMLPAKNVLAGNNACMKIIWNCLIVR